jgi:hypothetical protein
MKTNEGFRHHARFVVWWPVTYWNENVLFGQGTMLDISHVACRLAGTMPVAVGMVLKVRIALPHREDPLYVHRPECCGLKDGLAYASQLEKVLLE